MIIEWRVQRDPYHFRTDRVVVAYALSRYLAVGYWQGRPTVRLGKQASMDKAHRS